MYSMDNYLQIDEIKKYQQFLQQQTGEMIDEESAALLWIRNFAHEWRTNHTLPAQCESMTLLSLL
jgi:hypothetical protein